MRAQLDHALDALCMGRSGAAVLADLLDLASVALLGWLVISLFLSLEPMP